MSPSPRLSMESWPSSAHLAVLSAYLPQDRRAALAAGRSLPLRSSGSALFADISGFTALTEALSDSRGPLRGAEELTRHLDALYEALISQVERYGGSVVSFAGDGITCWFDDARASHGSSGRAVACGLRLQEAVRDYGALRLSAGRSEALAIKVSIASGSVRRLLVGDPQIQYLDTLVGETVARMAAGERLARPGEVLADAATVEELGSAAQVADWRRGEGGARFAVLRSIEGSFLAGVDPHVWPRVSLAAEQVRPWVLPAVYEHEISGQGGFFTEFRPAVALFLRFSGIDYESEEGAAQLDGWIRQVQAIVDRQGGALLQLTIGDKGSFLYAAFGAPMTHGDDARRAAKAALQLRDAARGAPGLSTVQIGLSRGTMRTGAYGSASRCAYGAIGDEVNLAARLMEAAAPHEVLVSGRVQAATGDAFTYQARPRLQVRGKAKAVPVYRLLREVTRRAALRNLPTEIVGRQAERSRIASLLDALQRGPRSSDADGGVLIIEGQAGIGKSRLAAALLERASARGIGTLVGWADAIERATPYHAWRPILSRILEWDTLPPESVPRLAAVRSRLRSLFERGDGQDATGGVGPGSPRSVAAVLELAPLLNAVLPLDLPENDATRPLQGEGRANRTNDLLSQIVQHYAAGEPLVLVLEDTQWLDSASWALARLVSLDVQPLLLVIVTRPISDPLPPEYRSFLDNPNLARLVLETLSPAEVLQLVSARLGVDRLPQQVGALILARAEGHPFFSEELAYALRDANLIQVEKGVCRVAPDVDLHSAAFPDTVQGVVASRIDLLSPQQQLTLKVASVIGRVFRLRVLRDIYPVPADREKLLDYLGDLQRLDITPLDKPPPDRSYLFKHVITQEVTYNLLLFAQRQMLHRAIAEWYERAHAHDLAAHYPLLAHHWQRAEAPDKALRYLALAGDQAMSEGAYSEAISFFSQALELESRQADRLPAGQRARWTLRLGQAYFNIGRLEEGRERLLRAATLLGAPFPRSAAALGLLLVKEMACQAWRRLFPRWVVEKRSYEVVARFVALSQVYEGLAEIDYMHGAMLRALYSGFRYVNLAEDAGAPARAQQARGYSSLALALGLLGWRGLAERYAGLALAAAREVQDLDARAWVHEALGVYYADRAAWPRSQALIEEGRRLAERAGHVRRWEEIVAYASAGHYFQGRLEVAMAEAVEVSRVARRQADRQAEGWGYSWQAKAALRLGRLEEALDLARRAERIYADLQLETERLSTSGVLLLIQRRRGETEAACVTAERVAAGLRQIAPTWQILLDSFEGLAEYVLSRREGDPAGEPCRLGIDVCRRFVRFARVFEQARPAAYVYRGWCEHLAGRPRRAQRWLDRGIAAARQYGMPYEEAMGRFHRGRFLPLDHPERERHLQQARAIFERLGATWDLQRVEAALAGS